MFDEFDDNYDEEETKSKKKKSKKIKADSYKEDNEDKKNNGKKILIILGIILVVCALGFGIYKAFSNNGSTGNMVAITLNDGTGIKTININSNGTYVNLDSPVREGYTFDGWYTQEVGGTVVTSVTLYKSVNANVLYAHWTPNKYKITFVLDNGSENIVLEQAYGTKIVAPTGFTKANSTFNGWSEEIPETVPARDMTFTAMWTMKTYTVYFNSNGGSGVNNKSVTYGSTYGELPVPSKNRYQFQGWYFDNGSFNNQVISASQVNITGDVTLYAKWKVVTPITIKINPSSYLNSQVITSYDQYSKLGDNQLSQADFYSSNYILVALNIDTCYDEFVSIAGYQVNSSRVIVTVNTKRHCNKCGFGRQYYLYEIDKNSVSSSARVVSEFNVLSNDGC